MKFEDLSLFTKKGQDIAELVRVNQGTALIYSIPLWVYCFISIDRTILSSTLIAIAFLFFICCLHFYSVMYAKESKWKILNYAPIWSTMSIISIIIIFLSDVINLGQMFTRGIAIIGICILIFWAMGISDEIVEDEE